MPRKMSNDDFVNKSKHLYPNQFDYRDCLYQTAKIKVRLYCLLHRSCEEHTEVPVDVSPDHHLNIKKGSGCKRCKQEEAAKRYSYTLSDVIKTASTIYGDKYDFSHAIYINAHQRIKGVCTEHSLPFETTYNQIKQGKCAGCEKCKSIKLERKGKSISASKTTSFINYVEKAKGIHGEKYQYREDLYRGLSKDLTFDCVSCKNSITTRASRHLEGVGCPNCFPRMHYIPFDESDVIQHIDSVQEGHYHVKLKKRAPKRTDSVFTIQCKAHMPKPIKISFGQASRKQRCLTCEPRVSLSVRRKMKKLIENHPQLDFSNYALSEHEKYVSFACNSHGNKTLPIEVVRKYGCTHCLQESNESYFFDNLPDEIKNRTSYSKVQISHTPLANQRLPLECIKHNRSYEQYANIHLDGKEGCHACRGEKITNAKNQNAVLNQRRNIEDFLKKAINIHGDGHYSYPFIEDEYFLKGDEITIHCNIHDEDLPRFPASEHITNGKSGGRGCKMCKSDQARGRYRRPWNDVIKAFSAVGLHILSDENEYENGRTKLLVECQNNHVNRKQIEKVLTAKQGCPECSGGIGEEITRILLSAYFDIQFKKVRFQYKHYPFLELDGYNKKHKLAFEYQGAPHILRKFHDSEDKWLAQLKRDEDTRQMCKEKGITLIEIKLFNEYSFNKEDVLARLHEGMNNAGISLDASKLLDIDSTIEKVTKGTNKLKEIKKIEHEHNITLVSELVWKGQDKSHHWQCNTCKHKFSNSLYQRKIAKYKCCPKCSRKIGSEKKRATHSQQGAKYLTKLSQTTHQQGIKLTTKEWIGSGYENLYEGECNYCRKPVTPFNRNQLSRNKILCDCEGWAKVHRI